MSEAEETKTGKKKHNPLLVFLKFILILLLAIIIAFAAWVAFSALDKKDSLSVIPNDFAAYVRTDHLWKTVNPLVDLKALDVFLADPKYGEVRNAVVNFRSSDLRNKKYVAFALDRRIDATYYTDGSFCASVNPIGFPKLFSLGTLFHTQPLCVFLFFNATDETLLSSNPYFINSFDPKI